MNPKIKICGMRDPANIQEIIDLNPDFMGFIFSEKSPRYVGEELDENLIKSIPKSIKKAGVFVNANVDLVLRNVKKYSLDLVQLHGDETPEMCKNLRARGISVIKAFSVNNDFIFNRLNNYKPICDYFLFDTKGHNYGGNGTQFDWDLLQNYDQEKPFFLSGGIGLEDAEKINSLPNNLNIFAIDINSRFELEPGMKNVKIISEFIDKVRPQLQEN